MSQVTIGQKSVVGREFLQQSCQGLSNKLSKKLQQQIFKGQINRQRNSHALKVAAPQQTFFKQAQQDPVLLGSAIVDSNEWRVLERHVGVVQQTHLRNLLAEEARCEQCMVEHNGVYLDFSRQRVQPQTMKNLLNLAKAACMREKIDAMFSGKHINVTEDRAVLHVATRARRDQVIEEEGEDQVKDVWEVLDKIKAYSKAVRKGEIRGVTGKKLKDVVAIGIGGSFLGPLFVHTSLKFDARSAKKARDRRLRFLANVDPIDVARALDGLNQEETLVVIVSKTFTTAETMLNARTVKAWLVNELGEAAVEKQMIAVSTNIKLVKKFGINPENTFGFKDWVGGRYSVCSAVGVVPLSLQYGFGNIEEFLRGANDMDEHFKTAPFEKNLPVLMGLLGVWNTSFLGYHTRAILPYCQALSKFPSHIQQVSMESNGKGVDINGQRLPDDAGEIEFGEPGTNGQHSFYQLIHQGRIVPCEFIGVVRSQQSVYLKNEIVSNHDELMCNFFAQADALAYGKDAVELRSENVHGPLIPHRTFTGNRPSLSLLLPELNAYTVGQLLALYEHRIAVEGFIFGINSFDQWGVELGKVLASKVRVSINKARTANKRVSSNEGYNYSTVKIMNRYLEGKTQVLYPEPRDVFPVDLLEHSDSSMKYEQESIGENHSD